jgi:hypothetical protein
MHWAMGGFQNMMRARLNEINKALPESLQFGKEWFTAPPKQAINKLMLLSYAMGLGGRVGANVRDLFQGPITSMPILGPGKYWKAVYKVLSDFGASAERAKAAGALLDKYNVGDLYADIVREMPANTSKFSAQRISNILLQPQRWTDNINRMVSFTAEYDSALENIKLYRAGKITAEDLMNNTSLWWNDKPAISRLLARAGQKWEPAGMFASKTVKSFESEAAMIDDIAKDFALEHVDMVHWPYTHKGMQPAMLRTGLGRLFGQYGMWPLNYMDFVRRAGVKLAEGNPVMKKKLAGAVATWMAANFAASNMMEGLGADVSNWFWLSPAAYGGSPSMKFTQALMQMNDETDQGRASRKVVLEYPLAFVPGWAEIKNMIRATSEESGGEGLLSPATIRVLGMKPLEKGKDREIDDQIKYELGYKGGRLQ